jgi:hypothetical protein
MDCGIRAHGGHSPNYGSTEEGLYKQLQYAHKRSTCNTYQRAMAGWDEGAKPGLE